MKKLDYEKLTLDKLKELGHCAEYGNTAEIANDAWDKYKDAGGKDWGYFAKWGKTEAIRNEAKSHIVNISEFLEN